MNKLLKKASIKLLLLCALQILHAAEPKNILTFLPINVCNSIYSYIEPYYIEKRKEWIKELLKDNDAGRLGVSTQQPLAVDNPFSNLISSLYTAQADYGLHIWMNEKCGVIYRLSNSQELYRTPSDIVSSAKRLLCLNISPKSTVISFATYEPLKFNSDFNNLDPRSLEILKEFQLHSLYITQPNTQNLKKIAMPQELWQKKASLAVVPTDRGEVIQITPDNLIVYDETQRVIATIYGNFNRYYDHGSYHQDNTDIRPHCYLDAPKDSVGIYLLTYSNPEKLNEIFFVNLYAQTQHHNSNTDTKIPNKLFNFFNTLGVFKGEMPSNNS